MDETQQTDQLHFSVIQKSETQQTDQLHFSVIQKSETQQTDQLHFSVIQKRETQLKKIRTEQNNDRYSFSSKVYIF